MFLVPMDQLKFVNEPRSATAPTTTGAFHDHCPDFPDHCPNRRYNAGTIGQ